MRPEYRKESFLDEIPILELIERDEVYPETPKPLHSIPYINTFDYVRWFYDMDGQNLDN